MLLVLTRTSHLSLTAITGFAGSAAVAGCRAGAIVWGDDAGTLFFAPLANPQAITSSYRAPESSGTVSGTCWIGGVASGATPNIQSLSLADGHQTVAGDAQGRVHTVSETLLVSTFQSAPAALYSVTHDFGRWRRVAINHSWSGTGNPTIYTRPDTIQHYPTEDNDAFALFTWSQPGIYEVHLTVANGDGYTHSGKRQVIIYTSREEAYDGVVGVSGIAGSIEQGGWGCQLRVQGDLSFLLNARDLQGYIPVVVFADTLFETGYGQWLRRAIGLNWQYDYENPNGIFDLRDDPRIIFSGYLDKNTLDINHDGSTATFEARGADLILEQMQTSAWGFFESAYDGSGIVYNDLNTASVIQHMLQEHSNFADWHDLRLFYDIYDAPPESGKAISSPQMEYKDWTFNQGMYWSNIRDMAENQFERAWVTHQGALCVMPDRNMWKPEVYYRRPDSLLARLPLEQDPVGMITGALLVTQEGEPIDTATACIPMTIKVTERLSQAVSYYKIIASLSYGNEEWGADYPKDKPAPASGKWVLVQGKYYSDGPVECL